MCKVMHWQLGITACKTRVELELQGVMPSCQGITQHNNPGIMRGSNDFKGAVEPSHCMVALYKILKWPCTRGGPGTQVVMYPRNSTYLLGPPSHSVV